MYCFECYGHIDYRQPVNSYIEARQRFCILIGKGMRQSFDAVLDADSAGYMDFDRKINIVCGFCCLYHTYVI